MDTSKLILTGAVSPPIPLDDLGRATLCRAIAGGGTGEIGVFSENDKKRVAKDFESVLLDKLLGEMRSTIGDWGFEEDGASEQLQGIFWLFLARHIAEHGGFGLWRDVYRFMGESAGTNARAELLDKSL